MFKLSLGNGEGVVDDVDGEGVVLRFFFAPLPTNDISSTGMKNRRVISSKTYLF